MSPKTRSTASRSAPARRSSTTTSSRSRSSRASRAGSTVATASAPDHTPEQAPPTARRAFIDLHCHSSASFDSLAAPGAILRTAAARGLTHIAITDHDRIDGALEAASLGPTLAPELTVIVGQEIRTKSGNMIGVFLREAVPIGLSPAEAIAAVRAQGGLIGIAHPFD